MASLVVIVAAVSFLLGIGLTIFILTYLKSVQARNARSSTDLLAREPRTEIERAALEQLRRSREQPMTVGRPHEQRAMQHERPVQMSRQQQSQTPASSRARPKSEEYMPPEHALDADEPMTVTDDDINERQHQMAASSTHPGSATAPVSMDAVDGL